MTGCATSDIELVWKNTPRSTLRPIKADFTYSAGEYDFLTCEINSNTAQRVEDSAGLLNETRGVEVKLNGETIRTMYFDPSNLKTGKDLRDSKYGGYLELHDLHEFFTSGSLDHDFNKSPLKYIYREIFRQRQGDKDPFTKDQPVFNLGENTAEGVESTRRFDFKKSGDVQEVEEGYSIDLDSDATPLEAIKAANNKLNINTHIRPNSDFVVGGYNGQNSWTASETGKGADYLIDSAGITQAYQKKLKRINIIGPIEVLGAEEDIERRLGSLGSALNHFDDPQSSGYQLQAVVEDPDVEEGLIKTINLDSTNPKEISEAGIRAFQEIDQQKQAGDIEIDVSVSNTKRAARIGDVIYIPEPKSCNLLETPAYREDLYTISSVRHKLSNNWKMELQLTSIPKSAEELEFRIGYVDNALGKTYTFEDVRGYKPDPRGVTWGGSITQEDLDDENDLNE